MVSIIFFIDETKEQLEIEYILNKIKVSTPFGKNLLKNLKPFKIFEEEALNNEFEKLEKTKKRIEKNKVVYKKVKDILVHFKSLELTLERIYNLETLSVTELFEIKFFLLMLNKLEVVLLSNSDNFFDFNIKSIKELELLLDPKGNKISSFYIYDSYSEELLYVREKLKNIESSILKQKKEKRELLSLELGIKIRPNGEVLIKKHREDVIKNLKKHLGFIYVSETMIHTTFKISESEVELEIEEISNLKLREEVEELKVRENLTLKINEFLEKIRENINGIANLDLSMAKAYFAIAFKLVRPEISNETILSFENGIHLRVQEKLRSENLEFMPVSMSLSKGMTCITGANMGGKTICLKLAGIMLTMAQLGLFVPCDKMIFKPLNFVFLSSSDGQSIDKGLSTFGAEMVSISEIIKISNNNGLILIDELARGTNPNEGYAISKAIINYLKNKSSISLITTHFDGLADDEDVLHLQVEGLSEVDFKDLEINLKEVSLESMHKMIHKLMNYKLRVINESEEIPKDAINISRLIGINEDILNDAKKIMNINMNFNRRNNE